MRTLACFTIICALAAVASANLIADPTCDTDMAVYSKSGTTADALPLDTWVGPSGGDNTNWDCTWRQAGGYFDHIGNTYQQSLSQLVAMPAAGNYVLQFDVEHTQVPAWANQWVLRGISSGDAVGATMQEWEGGGTVIAYDTLVTDTSGAWQTVSVPFTIDATAAAESWLMISFTAGGDSGGPAIDNVSVTPEPASLSLLGLGALALIRRRR